jgi:hypothetical protein
MDKVENPVILKSFSTSMLKQVVRVEPLGFKGLPSSDVTTISSTEAVYIMWAEMNTVFKLCI